MDLNYSFIVPVFNRPQEIRELLHSMQQLEFECPFEVVIIEDGSDQDSEKVVEEFSDRLQISYYKKENSGPGDSRNFGMQRAKGNYFLILDSDVLLPPDYLTRVDEALQERFVDCFGGPDAAHEDFSKVQKAINYSMTSFFTTGGIRGGSQKVGKFQPRSFNMGLSKKAFESSGGFGRIHPGEDPDLALRLRDKGYETTLISEAYVYHKRRIDWSKFYRQVYKFGLVRPILNKRHPGSGKITFWFPFFFSTGFITSIVLLAFGISFPFVVFLLYFVLLFLDSTFRNKSVQIGLFSIWAAMVQFFGYALGFCRSTYYIRLLNQSPEKRFPQLFFKDAKASKSAYQNQV